MRAFATCRPYKRRWTEVWRTWLSKKHLDWRSKSLQEPMHQAQAITRRLSSQKKRKPGLMPVFYSDDTGWFERVSAGKTLPYIVCYEQ